MIEALYDLEQVLRSRRVKWTPEEANVMLEWRPKAMRDFTIGSGVGATVSWLALRRFSNVFRLANSMMAAAYCGVWNGVRSIDSVAEHVLSLEGTLIQKEMATIMLNKYGHDPTKLQRYSKFFYREEVFVDTSADKPIFRWRLVNAYGDPNNHFQESYGEETESKKNDVKKSTVENNEVKVNDAVLVADPFNIMFQIPVGVENVPESNAPSTSSRRNTYRQRRRHRRHHQEETDF